MVTGHDWKHIGALIVPRFERLKEWCLAGAIAYDPEDLTTTLSNEKIKELYRLEIRKYLNPGAGLKDFEMIREFRLLPKPFAAGRELTATLKMKRRFVVELYSEYVKSMGERINRSL